METPLSRRAEEQYDRSSTPTRRRQHCRAVPILNFWKGSSPDRSCDDDRINHAHRESEVPQRSQIIGTGYTRRIRNGNTNRDEAADRLGLANSNLRRRFVERQKYISRRGANCELEAAGFGLAARQVLARCPLVCLQPTRRLAAEQPGRCMAKLIGSRVANFVLL